jgi:hypothetical protein
VSVLWQSAGCKRDDRGCAADTITGGSGKRYRGNDVVYDFDIGTDRLDVGDVARIGGFAHRTITRSGTHRRSDANIIGRQRRRRRRRLQFLNNVPDRSWNRMP